MSDRALRSTDMVHVARNKFKFNIQGGPKK